MKHRIVVLGAGYAGAFTAGNLARRLSPTDAEITVVNAEPEFVQRLRLHQLAAGQQIAAPKLADVFAGPGSGCASPGSPPSRAAISHSSGGDQSPTDPRQWLVTRAESPAANLVPAVACSGAR